MAEQSKSKITALVVDDTKMIRVIHCGLLNSLGIQNEVACDGEEAVAIHASGKRFDLILMDMDMPVMNGIKATRALRNMGIKSIIVGVSSHSKEQVQEFVAAGLNEYQEKPLSKNKLEAIIQTINPPK